MDNKYLHKIRYNICICLIFAMLLPFVQISAKEVSSNAYKDIKKVESSASTGGAIIKPTTPSVVTTNVSIITQSTSVAALMLMKDKIVIAPNETKRITTLIAPATFSSIGVECSDPTLIKVTTASGVLSVSATGESAKERGKRVNILIKAGDKEQLLQVAIKNKAKKIKAAKKKYIVKKGKKVKAVFNIKKAQNKNNAITDLFTKEFSEAVKCKKKILNIENVIVKTSKIKIIIKGRKKGKTPLNLKLSKKAKAKTKIIVK